MHEALANFKQPRITFPQAPSAASAAPPQRELHFFNPLVAANLRQKQAVLSILGKSHGSSPFILFGPPGTGACDTRSTSADPLTRSENAGKTVTIVEAVNQIVSSDPSARVLICAPSNSACDVVASRLVSLGSSRLFRLYAPYHHPVRVPAALNAFTMRQEGVYVAPAQEQLCAFQVVVVTCATGNMSSRFDVAQGHFSHIFIDECGQAEEPEGELIPLLLGPGVHIDFGSHHSAQHGRRRHVRDPLR